MCISNISNLHKKWLIIIIRIILFIYLFIFIIKLDSRLDLCGEEVTSDYPHEEVKCLGVNHFPDGVFQKCRTISNREKEEERQRLMKLRRMKNKNAAAKIGSVSFNSDAVTSTVMDDWDSEPDPSMFAAAGAGKKEEDIFDQHWSQALVGANSNVGSQSSTRVAPAPQPQPGSSSVRSPSTGGGVGGGVGGSPSPGVGGHMRQARSRTNSNAASPGSSVGVNSHTPINRLSLGEIRGSPAKVVPSR